MNGKQLAAVLAVLGLVSVFFMGREVNQPSEFELWKKTNGVEYDSMYEEAYRERVFLENLAKINLHNSNKYRTYDMGINQFTAMTQEEFEQSYLGLIAQPPVVNESTLTVSMGDIDWVAQGAVTGVKDQGQCGSCWAFSATGGLEGLSKLSYGSLQSFSEQQLVDCSGPYGNQACNGGLMSSAFKYVKDHGIVLENEYPYRAVKQACSKDQGPFKISGYTDIADCNTLANAINRGPVSVAVDASTWSAYRGGVLSSCGTRLNHGVTLVGINGGNWWIKNSWNTSWGEKGFIRLAAGNTCGVCNMASVPNK